MEILCWFVCSLVNFHDAGSFKSKHPTKLHQFLALFFQRHSFQIDWIKIMQLCCNETLFHTKIYTNTYAVMSAVRKRKCWKCQFWKTADSSESHNFFFSQFSQRNKKTYLSFLPTVDAIAIQWNDGRFHSALNTCFIQLLTVLAIFLLLSKCAWST